MAPNTRQAIIWSNVWYVEANKIVVDTELVKQP